MLIELYIKLNEYWTRFYNSITTDKGYELFDYDERWGCHGKTQP